MLAEAFPRLAVRLRSTFPDADIRLVNNGMGLKVGFPNFPAWEVEVTGVPCHEQFQLVQSTVSLRYECLQDVPEEDFLRLIAGENLGLRGATLLAERDGARRGIRIRTTFLGQKGRTRDEAESLAIDVLSILRYARLLEDRILRSTAGETFSYELYYSQYLSKGLGRNRFINYARSIFQGSTERVFGQVTSMLRDDYKYPVQINRPFVATIVPPSSNLEIVLRIPEEIPMLSCCTSLYAFAWNPARTFELVSRLNWMTEAGHFEVNADGSLVSFVSWKHLTNDLRYYSLDHVIDTVHTADRLLQSELPARKDTSGSQLKANASSLEAYKAA